MKRSLKYPFIVGVLLVITYISFALIPLLEGSFRYVLISLVAITILAMFFLISMSPTIFGLFKNKKNLPDKNFDKLTFASIPSNNIKIEYSSNEDESKLVKLRNDFNLDNVVKSAKSDYEKVKLIQTWVHKRWKHDGNNAPKFNDAYYILKQAEKGERFRCVEYSLVTCECLRSIGLIVRNMGIWTKDISDVDRGGAHVINEVYLRGLQKWIFLDPQFDIIITENEVPLNAVEIQNAIAEQRNIQVVSISKTISPRAYISWIRPYLYYFTISINKGRVTKLDRIFGIKKNLTLYPLNASKPQHFQGLFPINTSYFTNSIQDIYQEIIQAKNI